MTGIREATWFKTWQQKWIQPALRYSDDHQIKPQGALDNEATPASTGLENTHRLHPNFTFLCYAALEQMAIPLLHNLDGSHQGLFVFKSHPSGASSLAKSKCEAVDFPTLTHQSG